MTMQKKTDRGRRTVGEERRTADAGRRMADKNRRTSDKGNKGRLWYLGGLVLLVFLAAVHGLDTRAGAIESGDLWLEDGYRVVAALGILAAAGLGALLLQPLENSKKSPVRMVSFRLFSGPGGPGRGICRLENIYLMAALIFGCLYLYVLPPLSAPDEVRHYISAYQISNRLLGKPAAEADGLGAEDKVPVREEDWFAEDSCGDYQPFLTEKGFWATDADGAEGAKVLGQTLTEETYRLIHEKGLFRWEEPREAVSESGEQLKETPVSAEKAAGEEAGTALSNHRPVVTTPCAYIVPALGITLARLLDLNSLCLMYLGRLFNLVFFAISVFFAMRRLPFGKEVMFGVALLPMTIHLSASFSYDVLIMAGVFYFTACCLDLAYRAERVRPSDVFVLAAIMAAAGPCKMVYAVFMGLCLLIPVRKFGGRGKWLLAAVCVFGAWCAAMVLVNSQTVASYATETDNYISWAGEAGFSLTMLFHQPVKTFQMFFNTVIWQAEYWHMTVIGAYLGNVDTVLDVPYLLVIFFTCALLLLAFRKPGEELVLVRGRRIWIWCLCLMCAGAVMLSMLISWTPVSSRIINGVQGRYFLPFLPVLLMTCKNNTVVLSKNPNRAVLYLMCCSNAYIVLRIYSIVSMRL